jgi:hypothetical protein
MFYYGSSAACISWWSSDGAGLRCAAEHEIREGTGGCTVVLQLLGAAEDELGRRQ